MKEGYNSVVALNDLLLKINIGVTEAERNVTQDVKISFKLYYIDYPKGCETDSIDDTICYHKIATITAKHCKANSVKLLEYLCFGLHKKIRDAIPDNNIKIWIKIEKCNPPIEGMLGGTSFEYADF